MEAQVERRRPGGIHLELHGAGAAVVEGRGDGNGDQQHDAGDDEPDESGDPIAHRRRHRDQSDAAEKRSCQHHHQQCAHRAHHHENGNRDQHEAGQRTGEVALHVAVLRQAQPSAQPESIATRAAYGRVDHVVVDADDVASHRTHRTHEHAVVHGIESEAGREAVT